MDTRVTRGELRRQFRVEFLNGDNVGVARANVGDDGIRLVG